MRQPGEEELSEVFRQMRKHTKEAQSINCTACGYHSCREMASAVYYGFTRKENCIHFLKDSVESQRLKLQYVAEHDDFLDVFNRRALIGRIEALPDASEYALVVVNMNGFKGINDTYGHKEADKLLVQIAENLKQGSEGFGALVARLKNDEFLLLYPGRTLEKGAPALLALTNAVERPVRAGSDRFHMSAKIGVVNAKKQRNRLIRCPITWNTQKWRCERAAPRTKRP